jgi:hypothetical protein
MRRRGFGQPKRRLLAIWGLPLPEPKAAGEEVWKLRLSATTLPRLVRGSSMKLLRLLAVALAAVLAACSPGEKQAETPASGMTVIRFATDWRAQAEHGGFYQAVANGEYARRGLDVRIVQGGPGSNVPSS